MAELPFEVEFRVSVPIPVYQRIAAQAADMRGAGAAFHAIAEYFGVDDHTAGKAVRWFRGELWCRSVWGVLRGVRVGSARST